MENPFLLVGLGNPGIEYTGSRHNIGYVVLDHLAGKLGCKFDESTDGYSISRCQIETVSIILLKPNTYMNLSGFAVKKACEQFSGCPDRLLIIYDDLNLPFGKLRLRAKGSDGGHKGVSSIIFHLQHQNFPRLRIGIGAQYEKSQMVDFVLSAFDEEEREHLPEVIQKATDGCLGFIQYGVEKAMNSINSNLNDR
jgi:PTH1 family peptidyl-tRNA hydrolase